MATAAISIEVNVTGLDELRVFLETVGFAISALERGVDGREVAADLRRALEDFRDQARAADVGT